MKLAEHVVLVLGLACMGGTFAGAASPNTTPQPPQPIPTLSVPTVATDGLNAPVPQPREDSKDPVGAIKIISEAAIKSAEADVEIVKWIFTEIAVLAALLGFLGVTTYAKARKLVQKKAKEESENLSELRLSISQMMATQYFIEDKHGPLIALVDKIRAMQPSDQGYSEKSSELKSIVKAIIEDLNRMREYDKIWNRLAPTREPRWAALIDGWHGFALHSDGRHHEAIPYLQRAIQLSTRRDPQRRSAEPVNYTTWPAVTQSWGKTNRPLPT